MRSREGIRPESVPRERETGRGGETGECARDEKKKARGESSMVGGGARRRRLSHRRFDLEAASALFFPYAR